MKATFKVKPANRITSLKKIRSPLQVKVSGSYHWGGTFTYPQSQLEYAQPSLPPYQPSHDL